MPKEDLEELPHKKARTSTTDEVSGNPLVPTRKPSPVQVTPKVKVTARTLNSARKERDLVKQPNKRVRSSATDEKSESSPVPDRVVTGTSHDSKSENEEDTSS